MEILAILKLMLQSAAFILVLWLSPIISCKKEDAKVLNLPPIARAGADQIITLSSCSEFGYAELNGKATTDPDHNVLGYRWDKLYGPPGTVRNRFSSIATVENILPGVSAFTLTVSDEGALYSTDTVLVSVIGKATEYDLDIIFDCDLSYTEQYGCYCYDLNCPPCYAITEIRGFGFFPPLGILMIHITEYVSTPASGNQIISNSQIYSNNVSNLFIKGSLDANFSKIIQQGGGPISSNFNFNSGSVEVCDSSIFKTLQPLSLTGILEPAVKRATVRVAGKVYF
jgi:hypothetical protein